MIDFKSYVHKNRANNSKNLYQVPLQKSDYYALKMFYPLIGNGLRWRGFFYKDWIYNLPGHYGSEKSKVSVWVQEHFSYLAHFLNAKRGVLALL